MNNNQIGSVIFDFDEIDSTNESAHLLAQEGFRDGTIISAKKQLRGRGRRGNHWYSPKGGLYCSLILRPVITIKDAWIFEKLVGLAVYQTIHAMINQEPTLKAPNDILVNRRKVAGILIETRGRGERLDYIIIGVGINCSTDLNCFPFPMQYHITTLSKEADRNIQASEVLKVFLDFFKIWYNVFLQDDLKSISDLWDVLAFGGGYD